MATTEKMLPPGMMPGKNEIEMYRQLYADAGFSLGERIKSFDSSVLPDEYILAFCMRYQQYTFVGDIAGWRDEPVGYRYDLMKIGYGMAIEELSRIEDRFRRDGDEKAFRALRRAFSTAVGNKVCVDYLKKQCDQYTAGELAAQTAEYKRKEEEDYAALQKKQQQEEKLWAVIQENPYLEDLYEYDLTDEEVDKIIDMRDRAFERSYPPEGYTRDHDWKRDQDFIPIMSEKYHMIRKAIKMNQRDFAKRIGYNINKYPMLERGQLDKLGFRSLSEAFPLDLQKRVVDATYANPYWLNDNNEDSIYNVDTEKTADTPEEAQSDLDLYPMFVTVKVIRHWWSRQGI